MIGNQGKIDVSKLPVECEIIQEASTRIAYPGAKVNHSMMRFSFALSLEKIRKDGFHWEDFQTIFPFGFLGIKEGEYAIIVNACLDSLPNDRERAVLLDLLDAQWCTFVEQIWIANEFGGNPKRFAGESHFALARLQMGENIRWERELLSKSGRSAMMSLGPEETLLDRIVAASPHRRPRVHSDLGE